MADPQMTKPSDEYLNPWANDPQRPKRQFDKPFFVITNGSSLTALREYLSQNSYDAVEWVEDKFQNDVARVKIKSERVATVCVKRKDFVQQVEALIEGNKSK